MFTVVVESGFSAVHRLRFGNGTVEAPHEHDWVVRAHFARSNLDDADMVIDFRQAREALGSVLEPFDQCDLNSKPELAGLNPTAEILARLIFERLVRVGLGAVCRVEVTEAPGCAASFEPPGRPGAAAIEHPYAFDDKSQRT